MEVFNNILESYDISKKWIKFKRWCYKHHKIIAIVMLIILVIIASGTEFVSA